LGKSKNDGIRLRSDIRDIDDDAFIHAAIAADACAIVSGDSDLLVLDPIGALRILTLRVALEAV